MFSLQVLMRFFDRGFVIRLLMIGLLISLLPLGDLFIFFYLNGMSGKYLLLALAAATALIGVLLTLRGFLTLSSRIKTKVIEGEYPEEEFAALAGIFLAGLFLVFPGFLTDFLGIVMLFPALRIGIGKRLIRNMGDRLKEVYEYLKMDV